MDLMGLFEEWGGFGLTILNSEPPKRLQDKGTLCVIMVAGAVVKILD